MVNERQRDPRHSESTGREREPHASQEHVVEDTRPWWTNLEGLRRVSWGAVFAGVVVALVIQLALGLLGLSIGFGVIDPGSPETMEGLGVGAGIWLLVSALIAFFVGGVVAAHLAGMPIMQDGMLHGVLVWGLATLFTFFMMTTAIGQVLSGAAGVIGQGVTAMGAEVEDREAPPRQVAIDLLATYTDMTRAEAEQAIEEFEREATEVAEDVDEEQVAERAVNVASQAALWAFLSMLLGVMAAAGGGVIGTPRDLPAASHSLRRD